MTTGSANVDSVSDRDLILQLQKGSLESLGLLYDRHQNLVYRTALAITGDTDAAADLLQDVFLRLYRFAGRIDPERPLEPWLYRMVTNLSYTWVKRQRRWLHPLESFTEWFAKNRKDALPSQPEVDDVNRRVQQAMASLPFAQRIVVVLYYVNDLPLQEIAEILNIPVGTVKSRLHYGRQALKSSLDEQSAIRLEMKYEFT